MSLSEYAKYLQENENANAIAMLSYASIGERCRLECEINGAFGKEDVNEIIHLICDAFDLSINESVFVWATEMIRYCAARDNG